MPRTQARSCEIGETASQRQGRDELDGPLHTTSLQGRLTPHPTQCPQGDAREDRSRGETGPYDHSHKWIQLEVPSPHSREAGIQWPLLQVPVSMPTAIKSCCWTANTDCNPMCPGMGRCCPVVFPGTGLLSSLWEKFISANREMILGGRGTVP